MKIKVQSAIIGAGPAGLSAALELAKCGADVCIFDENARPGGQLFKQIHKFFGSKPHGAGIRGFKLGETLLEECRQAGVKIRLNQTVFSIFPDRTLGIAHEEGSYLVEADNILIATGASERPLVFPGWTLPGVMGAGAAQTMININRVLPGKRVLMIGSGNVGLVVSYQLLQAGAEVVGIVEALPRISGYMVHANKVMRAGVPIYLAHTIQSAGGNGQVERATIVGLGPNFAEKAGTEKNLDVDTVCLAVGLNPSVELAKLADCELIHLSRMGGFLPVHDPAMRTTVPGVYVAGDVSGIEEASTAMEEGRLAGIGMAQELGLLSDEAYRTQKEEIEFRILELRAGPHGTARRQSKDEIIRRYPG
jgi:NADPH-dependent 2,4-dienoyl-CoA reductase/sulfur reductase-like enzyme